MRRGISNEQPVELRHVAKFKGFDDPIDFGDKVKVKNFMSHGKSIGDVIMSVTMHTCNRVQLESRRLGFRGWFPMRSDRLERIEN